TAEEHIMTVQPTEKTPAPRCGHETSTGRATDPKVTPRPDILARRLSTPSAPRASPLPRADGSQGSRARPRHVLDGSRTSRGLAKLDSSTSCTKTPKLILLRLVCGLLRVTIENSEQNRHGASIALSGRACGAGKWRVREADRPRQTARPGVRSPVPYSVRRPHKLSPCECYRVS